MKPCIRCKILPRVEKSCWCEECQEEKTLEYITSDIIQEYRELKRADSHLIKENILLRKQLEETIRNTRIKIELLEEKQKRETLLNTNSKEWSNYEESANEKLLKMFLELQTVKKEINELLIQKKKEVTEKLPDYTSKTNIIYDKLFVVQKGKCAICKAHQSKIKKKLCVDHDHTTGKVRGLLCGKCNTGLGFFKDRIENLSGAILYLKLNSTSNEVTL